MPLVQTRGAASAQGFGEFSQPAAGSANYIDDVFSTWLYTSNGFTLTVPNGIALGTDTGGSVRFSNTTTAYLTAPANTAYQFGTGDFCVEFFIRPTASITQTPIDMGYTNTGSYVVQYAADYKPYWYSGTTGILFTSATAFTVNAWNHLVVCRSGTTLSMFVNGTRTNTATNSTNYNANFTLGIGGTPTHTEAVPVRGFMSNVRLVKGSSVYDPSASSITIPTAQLTAISGTSILTCQLPNATTDYSTINATLTATNAIAQNGGGPFTSATPGKGGLVWMKARNTAGFIHALFDTSRGVQQTLCTNDNSAQATETGGVTSFNTNGFTVGSWSPVNSSSAFNYASWTFAEQPKFFDIVTYTGTGASNQNVSHNLGSVPGMIIVKRTDTADQWNVYHRSLGNTKFLLLNSDAAEDTQPKWGNTTPTSTVFTVGGGENTNTSGGTYVAYLFAHDAGGFGAAGTDNVISCGSFTTSSTGAGSGSVTLGYEPQYILFKKTNDTQSWFVIDVMRGIPNGGDARLLRPNTSGAEDASFVFNLNATGFTYDQLNTNQTYIYMAIRRPMKPPTSGTQVFSPQIASGVQTTGFVVDTQLGFSSRSSPQSYDANTRSRLTGAPYLVTSATDAEAGTTSIGFDSNTGLTLSWSAGGVNWYFRRAPGFFDQVCYTGTGSATTVAHNLGVAPELMIIKSRSNGALGWYVYSTGLGPTKCNLLNQTNGQFTSSTFWNDTAPTSSVFSLGSGGTNGSGNTQVAYLFASIPGVSKVGSYTGTGATQTINCAFTTGARFVLIKRTDDTGDWWVWDTARGMVTSTDPRLALNSTAAELNNDWVFTTATGFQIVTTDATINASGSTYIFLAIA